MKKITLIAAAFMASTAVANAGDGLQLKNCVLDLLAATMIGETPWMAELIAMDPSTKHLLVGGMAEGLLMVPEEDWDAMASEDLSPLREEPADMLLVRWMYDAAADCSLILN